MNNLSGGYIMVDLSSPNKVKQLAKAVALNKPLLVYYENGTTEWGKVTVTYETIDDVEVPTYHITTANGFVTVEADGDTSARPLIIEGDITPETITGLTFTYCKWSLSGTHLMIVLAGTCENVTLTNNATFSEITLPEFIMNKIVPLTTQGRVSHATLDNYYDYSYRSSCVLSLVKGANVLRVIGWGIGGSSTLTAGTFRVQFDLIIDNE